MIDLLLAAKWVKDHRAGIVRTVAALAFLATIATCAYHEDRADTLAAQRDAAVAQERIATGANQTLRETIATQRDALARWAKVGEAGQAVQESAVAEIARLRSEIEARPEVIRIERERIYELPGCNELANLDVAAVCPALAASLRAEADRAYRDGGGSGPGADQAP